MGYITGYSLTRWLNIYCSFKLSEKDSDLLQEKLDRNSNFKIERKEFIASVGSGNHRHHKQEDGDTLFERDEEEDFDYDDEEEEVDACIDKYVPKGE